MSAQNGASIGTVATGSAEAVIRQHAEVQFAEELAELAKGDDKPRPPNWVLSPWAVRTYLLGGKLSSGFTVTPKYIGNARLIEIAVATLATDRALLLYGVPGTAKCVKHDTVLLDTRTGRRMTVAEAYRERTIELATLNSDYHLQAQAPADYLDNGVRPCYRVTTHLGREIEVTLNHPFLTMDGWSPLEKLRPGDRIALPRMLSFFGDATLSDAHVKLLAHLLADGSLSQELPAYSHSTPEMKRDFSEAVATAFPELEAQWSPDGTMCRVSGGRHGATGRNPCTTWLRELGLESGLIDRTSHDTFVPEIVFMLPKRQIALFLHRLFSSGGFLHLRPTTQHSSLDYASTSKRLILDVQHLLLRFGINARVHRESSGRYRLCIHGNRPAQVFFSEIGLLRRTTLEMDDAITSPEACAGLTTPPRDPNPAQAWNRSEQAATGAAYAHAAAFVTAERGGAPDETARTSVRRGQRTPEAHLSRRAAMSSDDDDWQTLAQSDIYWDSIVSIEPTGEHQVYDLSMAETHNFVANDIVVHNSWVSEHMSAAIAGDSTLLIQGTAGTDESAIRYGWNYARLLVEGPSEAALVVSPMMSAMRDGKIARIEELTRIPSEVQDTLITILSEKTLPVPELNMQVQARKGFNVVGTANNRDKGVNELSSALLRRFNTVILPVPSSADEEIDIVDRRVSQLGRALELPAEKPALDEIRRVVTIFRELRNGLTEDGKTKLKSPSGTLSTAEAISVMTSGLTMAAYYGDGAITANDMAAGLTGAIVKDPVQDRVVWLEYLQTVVKERDGWKDLYRACHEVI